MPDRKQVQHRDSKTGHFITKREADRRPAQSEREVIRHPAPKKK